MATRDNDGLPTPDEEEEVTSSSTAVVQTTSWPLKLDPGSGQSNARPDGGNSVGPTFFCRQLEHNTNLNLAPKNWLMAEALGPPRAAPGHLPPSPAELPVDRLMGFKATPHYSGFSSFRMAALFLEYCQQREASPAASGEAAVGLDGIDVISDSENIKQLLRLPFNRKEVLSMVVHKVGKTLLIDDLDVARLAQATAGLEWAWLREFFFNVVLRSIESKDKVLVRRNTARNNAIQERNLVSKFLYRSLESSSSSPASITLKRPIESRSGSIEVENSSDTKLPGHIRPSGQAEATPAFPSGPPPLPELKPDDVTVPEPKLKSASQTHEFARTLLWNFEDIRMLIGSDMPIFGDADHPSVSLRLHSAKKPINILTGLDYWLDNLMCQVPDVLMCYHLDGLVQKYEILKTEDLPNLSDHCNFKPKVIRDVAQNILSFLKSNATKEGHTYWLFKGKDDDIVKLYDLTSLCDGEAAAAAASTETGTKQSSFKESPFKTAVAMLLYKVARNVLHGGGGDSAAGGTAQKLLINCLKLLDKEKYPHIATSVNFMLSDIYFPDHTNPMDIQAARSSEGKSYCQSEDSSEEDETVGSGSSTSSGTNDVPLVDVATLMVPGSQMRPHPFDGGGETYSRAKLRIPRDVIERCATGLAHVAEGLKFLHQFTVIQAEQAVEADKAREAYERDHPRMSRPHEPIPMPDGSTSTGETKVATVRPVPQAEQTTATGTKMPWQEQLKIVLLRKAMIIYIVMAENHFISQQYGSVLRDVKRAMNCHGVVTQLSGTSLSRLPAGPQTLIVSFAFGIAGDAYMNMVRDWGGDKVVSYQEQFNAQANGVDALIAESVEACVDEEYREWTLKFPKDIEESMTLAKTCFDVGLDLFWGGDEADRSSLIRRRGNANNEIGVYYMNTLQEIVLTHQKIASEGEGGPTSLPPPVEPFFTKSKMHLVQGIEDFAGIEDGVNQALLLSNMGKLSRLEAMFHSIRSPVAGSSAESLTRTHYNLSLGYYKRGLDALGARRANQLIYDSIVWEMSTVHFALACHLMDDETAEATEALEQEVVDNLNSCIHYVEIKLKVAPEDMVPAYKYRYALAHYKLGSLHHAKSVSAATAKNPMAFKRKQSKAESHYAVAVEVFEKDGHHGEYLRTQLERVCLFEASTSEQNSFPAVKRSVHAVLDMLTSAVPVLEAMADASVQEKEDVDQDLLKLFLVRMTSNLKLLNKTFSQKASKKSSVAEQRLAYAKKLYLMTIKLDSDKETYLKDLIEVLYVAKKDLHLLN